MQDPSIVLNQRIQNDPRLWVRPSYGYRQPGYGNYAGAMVNGRGYGNTGIWRGGRNAAAFNPLIPNMPDPAAFLRGRRGPPGMLQGMGAGALNAITSPRQQYFPPSRLNPYNAGIPMPTCSCTSCLQAYVYGYNQSHSHNSSRSSNPPPDKHSLPFTTKDITIRGKAYAVRKSFLDDNGKFEADLTKYIDKKKEAVVPDKVVGHLLDLINDQEIYPATLYELVSLNILATGVGSKSCVVTSQKLLDEAIDDVNLVESGKGVCDIVGAVMLSSRVDDGLKAWLKKWLKKGVNIRMLDESDEFEGLCKGHPEVYRGLQEMLGLVPAADDSELKAQ